MPQHFEEDIIVISRDGLRQSLLELAQQYAESAAYAGNLFRAEDVAILHAQAQCVKSLADGLHGHPSFRAPGFDKAWALINQHGPLVDEETRLKARRRWLAAEYTA